MLLSFNIYGLGGLMDGFLDLLDGLDWIILIMLWN
jgi:hypothetical protein